ncbi:MAG TPA: hypothetical protein VKG01_13180 [Thermoanaerobaculia bacterium]|nr:hypothetical protein [Thermoanaerobaculia bacterium]
MTTAKRVTIAAAIAVVLVGLELLVVLNRLDVPVLFRVALANLFLIPFALALRLPGASTSGPSLAVVGILGFLQWFLIGFLVLLPFGRRRRPQRTP